MQAALERATRPTVIQRFVDVRAQECTVPTGSLPSIPHWQQATDNQQLQPRVFPKPLEGPHRLVRDQAMFVRRHVEQQVHAV